MTLRGIEFGHVFNASGAQGFFGEGYPFHETWRKLGLTFESVTFVSKTTTLNAREGNMPLRADKITPSEMRPKCIQVKFFEGVVLNAVGLSGPGAKWLLEQGRWQKRTKPFLISFMSVAPTAPERLSELQEFVSLMLAYRQDFHSVFGIQANKSCPNTGHDPTELIEEIREESRVVGELERPVEYKFNVLANPKTVVQLVQDDPYCDSICISNTLPYGERPDLVNWKKIFGSEVSPLLKRNEKFGGGGLSGKPLLPLVEEWIRQARNHGLTKPINAGGGVLGPNDARRLLSAGADAVSLGSIGILRPWQMKKTIHAISSWFEK